MTHKFILESFWQKGHNCAFVAFTKAAIMKFGPGSIFSIEENADHFLVRLRNDRQLKISKSEVRKLNRMNKVGFRRAKNRSDKDLLKKMKQLVRISFAIIVRNMSEKGYQGRLFTPAQAITAVNDEGIKTTYFHSLLGLKRTVSRDLKEDHIRSLKQKRAILLFTERHIVAASKGHYDKYGRAIKMGNELPFLIEDKVAAYYSLK